MDYATVTPDMLENVKRVLFGKQKQANVTNEAVVRIVADDLIATIGASCLSSEDAVVDGIKSYLLQNLEGNLKHNDVVLMLIVGEAGHRVITLGEGPRVVSAEQPNAESPKRIFRVYQLGETPEPIMSGPVFVGGPVLTPPSSGSTPSSSAVDQYDYKARVEQLKKDILPLVPDAVKKELSDPTEQCLCCAEFYYNM